MAKRWEYRWHWRCWWEDNRHGGYHADYEGHCTSGSRNGFKTEELALNAGKRHEQEKHNSNSYQRDWSGNIATYRKRYNLAVK